MTKVNELPSMTIVSIDRDTAGIVISGRFDRLDGVRKSGWFWPGPGQYLFAELTHLDSATRAVVFTLNDQAEAERLSVGDRLPWFDGLWQVPVVQAIIDESHVWRPVTFQAPDAVHFRLGDGTGWQPMGGTLPKGAVVTGVESGGWDHEHCSICDGYIDLDRPKAYTTADGHWWLCSDCYERYGKTHDVSFQLGA